MAQARCLLRGFRLHPSPLPCADLRLKRYEALAAEIEASIRNGVLQPGDRLPSVRSLCHSRGISASTVFQAYYLLEARGVVSARERSGRTWKRSSSRSSGMASSPSALRDCGPASTSTPPSGPDARSPSGCWPVAYW